LSLTSGLLHLAQLALTDIPHFAQEYVAIIFPISSFLEPVVWLD